jgi:2,3-bisphosphoglycerate-independent phosphoglycerate mutase
MDNPKLVILAVLDGWGIAPAAAGNAVSLSNTPNINRFWASFPHTQLAASGEAVGLPRGEVGNTETGHLNLGAGRVVYQDLARINMSIADGSFSQNDVLLGACNHAKTNNSQLHIMGLVGAGGVHSNLEHLFALIQMAAKAGVTKLFIHMFTDGRDSAPTSALTYISQIRASLKKENIGQIASVMGRYWAMDRDMRWERTAKAYFALTRGEGHKVKTVEEAIQMSYDQGRTDEFIEPSIVSDAAGNPITTIAANDAVIFFNFRIDRPRQLAKAFVLTDWSKVYEDSFDPYEVKYTKKHSTLTATPRGSLEHVFDRGEKLPNIYFATMTEYSKTIAAEGAHAAFPPEHVISPLGRVISDQGLKQLRVAESEKERFVTFYFNGQQEQSFPLEERLIISSPQVPTYDKKPEMSAKEMTDALLGKIFHGEQYSFILVNFANADMVGHTGNIGAAVTACETVDQCLGKLSSYVMAYDGILLITADHGNAEEMIKLDSGEVDTEHSNSPVPFIAVSPKFVGKSVMLQSGVLADVAPTILKLLNLEVPQSMIGRDLLAPLKS